MYQLTLTKDERRAISWVGYRYFNGDELHGILSSCMYSPCTDDMPENVWLNYDGEITFDIPEHWAWEIKEGLESEDSFCPCFNEQLTNKLRVLCDSVV